ncbi:MULTISPECIES: hypothetical protein [unclassified Corynebacterium]|uniref:hypothetical protein n=1 Tax=unclassified Corynebacterium TaxID=2624378 RepID=UPI001C457612|nr:MULTISPECIES: hypothetical protein [unclassified Corynebacterium]MBV7282003.1 hypothetical protein [Corynebacterium sp. TAE3-ERU30]MBV7303092.1 hypothetical protein [Corynebacterium sp. TAE3-ERU2]
MPRGLLVHPDSSSQLITFELEDAAAYLGADGQRVSVTFRDDGTTVAALYAAAAASEGAEPNPVASMGRQEATTGNSAFLTDPTNAVCGPVLFVGADGSDISDDDIEQVRSGIRAVDNYRQDEPEDYALWRAAVLNLGRRAAE